jgi:hypothetical protein
MKAMSALWQHVGGEKLTVGGCGPNCRLPQTSGLAMPAGKDIGLTMVKDDGNRA